MYVSVLQGKFEPDLDELDDAQASSIASKQADVSALQTMLEPGAAGLDKQRSSGSGRGVRCRRGWPFLRPLTWCCRQT